MSTTYLTLHDFDDRTNASMWCQICGPCQRWKAGYGSGSVVTPMRLPGGEMYVGELKSGEPRGKGRLTYHNGFSFTGDFAYGVLQFGGVVADPQNVPLTGYFTDVPYLGYGTFTGFFANGQREGHGVFTFTSGATYEGSFSGDQRNGTFLKTEIDSEKFEEIYVDGKFQTQKPAGSAELQAAADRRVAAELKRNAESPKSVVADQTSTTVQATKNELQADKSLVAQVHVKTVDNTQLQGQLTQLQMESNAKTTELAQITLNATNLQSTIKKSSDDLIASNKLVADLQKLVRTRGNEFTSQLTDKQTVIDQQNQTITVQKSNFDYEINKLRHVLEQQQQEKNRMEQENTQLRLQVQQLSSGGQIYVQQLQLQISQLNAQLQNSSTLDPNGQLTAALQQIQKHELEVSKLQQANSKQENDMLRAQMQQTNDIMKLNYEIMKLKDENRSLQNELAIKKTELTQTMNNAQPANVCKKCGAQFIDSEDFAEHEASCTRIRCPLCDMTFKREESFFEHIDSHKKRDNGVSE